MYRHLVFASCTPPLSHPHYQPPTAPLCSAATLPLTAMSSLNTIAAASNASSSAAAAALLTLSALPSLSWVLMCCRMNVFCKYYFGAAIASFAHLPLNSSTDEPQPKNQFCQRAITIPSLRLRQVQKYQIVMKQNHNSPL